MEKLLELIEPYLDASPVWVSVLVVLSFILIPWWLVREWKLLGSPGNPSIDTRIQWLQDKTIPSTYQHGLEKLLQWLDRWFGKAGAVTPGSRIDKRFGIQPWTALSFERLMLLAVLYPLLFVLIGWLFGNVGQLGELVVLKPAPTGQRLLTMLLLSGAAFSFYRYNKASGWRSLFLFLVSLACMVGYINTATGAGAGAGAGAVAFAFAFAFAGAVAFAFAFAFAFAGAFAFAFAGAFAGAFAFAFEYLRDRSAKNSRLAHFWSLGWLFLLLYLCVVSLIIVIWGKQENIQTAFTVLLFLGILPLVNAPLDWLSFGFTRGLLHSITTQRRDLKRVLGVSILDIGIAIVFLVLVALSSLLGLMLVNTLAQLAGAESVIDLSVLWKQLNHGGWQQNLWIWLMLGSTLIPTLIHFLVAVFALAVVLPHRPGEKAAEALQRARAEFLKRDCENSNYLSTEVRVAEDERRIAFFLVIVRQSIVVILFVGLLWLLWTFVLSQLPYLLSWIMLWFGGLMGA